MAPILITPVLLHALIEVAVFDDEESFDVPLDFYAMAHDLGLEVGIRRIPNGMDADDYCLAIATDNGAQNYLLGMWTPMGSVVMDAKEYLASKIYTELVDQGVQCRKEWLRDDSGAGVLTLALAGLPPVVIVCILSLVLGRETLTSSIVAIPLLGLSFVWILFVFLWLAPKMNRDHLKHVFETDEPLRILQKELRILQQALN